MQHNFSEYDQSGIAASIRRESVSTPLFLLSESSLLSRLRCELRQAIDGLAADPATFLKSILRGEGLTRRSADLLQSDAALAVTGYALLFVLLSLLRLPAPAQAGKLVEVFPPQPDPVVIPVTLMRPVTTRYGNSASQVPEAGGSSHRPQKTRGGGGGGDNNPAPSQAGALPVMLPQPSIVKPKVEPPPFNPSLPVIPTIVGDEQALLKMKGPTGNPSGEKATNSNGPGTGKGIGNGNGVGPGSGDGAGKGKDGNAGGDSNTPGSGPPGGNGIGAGYTHTTRPVILFQTRPQYTEEARRNRVTGRVVLNAVFGADGQIYDIQVRSALPDGLTEEAIKALRKIRFRPATRNGQAVGYRMNVEFSFNIF